MSGWRCALLFRVVGLVLWFMGDGVALWGLWWRFIGCSVGKSIVFRFSFVLAKIDVGYLGLVDFAVCRWLAGGVSGRFDSSSGGSSMGGDGAPLAIKVLASRSTR